MLVAYCHDMVAIGALRDRGAVSVSGPVAHSMEEAVRLVSRALEQDTGPELELILQEEEDGELRWVNGISVQENDRLNMRLAQYRQVSDILNHGIGRLKGNPEVDEWLKANGGLTKVNEILCGRNLTSPRGWYNATRRYLKRHLGHEPSPLGERTWEHADSATQYSGYAINVHRTMANRRAHGEVPDMDGLNDWQTTEVDLQIIPGWFKKLSMSQKLIGHKAGSGNLTVVQQIIAGLKPDGVVPRLRPILCVGDELGRPPFTFLYDKYSDAVVDRNLTVQDLLWRFRNAPDRMLWKKVQLGKTNMKTWVAGIRTPKGHFMWLSLSKQSNEKFDYFTNDGENVKGCKINFLLPPKPKGDTYDKFVLVKGHRWIRTSKEGDLIKVFYEATKSYPDCKGKDYMVIVHIKDEELDPRDWGKKKKALIKEGWKPVCIRKGTAKPKSKEDHQEMDI